MSAFLVITICHRWCWFWIKILQLWFPVMCICLTRFYYYWSHNIIFHLIYIGASRLNSIRNDVSDKNWVDILSHANVESCYDHFISVLFLIISWSAKLWHTLFNIYYYLYIYLNIYLFSAKLISNNKLILLFSNWNCTLMFNEIHINVKRNRFTALPHTFSLHFY